VRTLRRSRTLYALMEKAPPPMKNSDIPRLDAAALASRAKAALERVCSGAELEPASRY